MADLFDFSILEAFSRVFVFLLVLVSIYVANLKSWLHGKPVWSAIVAFVLALIVVVSDWLVKLILYLAPVMVGVIFLLIVILVTVGMFTPVGPGAFGGPKSPDSGKYNWVIYVLVLVIFVATMIHLRSDTVVPGDLDEDGKELKDQEYNTVTNFIFHPNFMALLFILIIGVFTVGLMTGKQI